MSVLQPFANSVRIPGPGDKVYKDECFYSFDSPESGDGLFVCLQTFLGFGRDYVIKYSEKTGRKVFVNLKKIGKVIDSGEGENDEVPEKIVRLAIGVEGGFQTDSKKVVYEEQNSIVCLPNFETFSLDDSEVPIAIQMSAKGVISAQSAIKKEEIESSSGTWEGDVLQDSPFAVDLVQLENPPKIPPKDWVCSKCSLANNLWLNLTDGSILCGRKFFDGSGGNNHALEHYRDTKYPLAVKLGTITSDGKADVYSYPEDDMVTDPFLQQHLEHFGINMKLLKKTEQSMVEMEIEMNQKYDEWSKLTESNSKLVPVYGPGYTGIENLGNSCYMNSVLQVLFTLPAFVDTFVKDSEATFSQVDFTDDQTKNCWLQMTKLGVGLTSGKYSYPKKDDSSVECTGIRPAIFKLMIGRGHPDFSGKSQQDAQEFLLHLLNVLEREIKQHRRKNCISSLQFVVEDRIECNTTKTVRYVTRTEDYIPFAIPMEASVNKAEVKEYNEMRAAAESTGQILDKSEIVRPKVPFSACLERFAAVETVDDFFSTAAQAKTTANKTIKLKTFPSFLIIQLKKFDIGADWVPYKLDVEVEMPDELDLTCLKSHGGPRDGEKLMPEESKNIPSKPVIIPDASIVAQLAEMGFPVEGCKKAVFHTNNSGAEAAMIYVMEHMEDEDFGTPFVNPTLPEPVFEPNPDGLAQLLDMSFTRLQATKALRATDNNIERAVDWIFSHTSEAFDDVVEPVAATTSQQASEEPGHPNGTKYKMVAFISHIGTSHLVGHYVCHILKEGRWVIFNDSKVALSENPPKGMGYLYLYQRIEE